MMMYEKVQGRDRANVKSVAEALGLEGSYTPRTYIEQIQLEKLVNEVMVWTDLLLYKWSLCPLDHFLSFTVVMAGFARGFEDEAELRRRFCFKPKRSTL